MGFVLGMIGKGASYREPILHSIGSVVHSFGMDGHAVWWGEEAVVVHVQGVFTPEDRLERMPLVFGEGRYVLAFDGRLDNRDELLPKLGLTQGQWADGEVVAKAIQKWDEEAFSHLVGDFAIVCWDSVERRLILASDPVAGRQLYYHASGEHIVFSSAATAVHEMIGRPCQLDLTMLTAAMMEIPEPPGHSWFQDICHLPSGHTLKWTRGKTKVQPFWYLQGRPLLHLASDQEYVEAGRSILDKVVASQLRSTGPVACHLSAGLDSGGIAATVARLTQNQRIAAFTSVTGHLDYNDPDRIVDEFALARETARLYPNIDHYPCPVDNPHGFTSDAAWVMGAPLGSLANYSWFSSKRRMAIESGSKVVFGGMSGNGTLSFNGGNNYRENISRDRVLSIVEKVLAKFRQGENPLTVLRREMGKILLFLRQASDRRSWLNDGVYWPICKLSPDFMKTVDFTPFLQHERLLQNSQDKDLNRQIRMINRTLWKKKRVFARYINTPYQMRDPLGDQRLVEFCLSLPRNQYYRHGTGRYLARRVLADRLPSQIIHERRRGLQNPDWLYRMGCQLDYYRSTLTQMHHSPLLREMMDLPRLDGLIENWPTDPASAPTHIYKRVLDTGVQIGEFVLWCEKGCPPPTPIAPFSVLADQSPIQLNPPESSQAVALPPRAPLPSV